MILINSKGWTVEYNSLKEEYIVTDPMGHTCITPKVRIINPDHFVISHPVMPEENIFPSMSVPCLAKNFRGALKELTYSYAERLCKKTKIYTNAKVVKTRYTRKTQHQSRSQ